MRKPLLALLLGTLMAGPAMAQEEPRSLIARALKARGGEDKVQQTRSSIWKIKGVVNAGSTFSGEIFSQLPDQFKVVLAFDMNGTRTTQTQALNDGRGWLSIDGQIQDMDADTLEQMKESAYVDHLSSLWPLLKDRSYGLYPLADADVLGKPAAGVKVLARNRPEVKLYFDKSSGLLTLVERRLQGRGDKQEVLRKAYLSDYQELNLAAADERLETARLVPDGPALVEFLRKQTLTDADRDKVRALIARLGDDRFAVREKATADLVAVGAAAVPLLRKATTDTDVEIARRAEDCLKGIDSGLGPAVVAAAVRLIAVRKPAGAVEALLAYLPGSADDVVAREVLNALAALAVTDGKPDLLLVQALADKDPVRRKAAAAALAKDGGAFEMQSGRRLTLNGLKVFRKISRIENGQKELDWEVLDVQFFNKLDDSLFAKP